MNKDNIDHVGENIWLAGLNDFESVVKYWTRFVFSFFSVC